MAVTPVVYNQPITPRLLNTLAGAIQGAVADAAPAVNVRVYGAVGDGTTDDGPAIQAALDTGRNVYLPRATYYSAQTLRYRKPWQRIQGDGHRTDNGTKILFGPLLIQWLVADSDVEGVSLAGCEIDNILLSSASYSAATGLVLNKAPLFRATKLGINQCNRCVDSFGSRSTAWTQTVFSAKRPGGWCMRLKGTGAFPGGIATIFEGRWDCAETGAGPASLGQEADGLVIEGAAATVTTYSLQIVRARRSFWAVGGTEGAGLTVNPFFLYNYDFQSDATGENGIRLDVAADVAFDRGWIQGCYFGSGVLMAAGCQKFVFRGYCGGASEHGFDLAGSRISLNDLSCGRNSVVRIESGPYASPGNNTRDNVIIRSTATDVAIMGGAIGRTENGTGLARYSVNVEAGATGVRLLGVDMVGSISGPLNDATGGEVSVVSCNGPTPRLTAPNATILELGNQNQTMLRVGNAAPTTVANRLRIAGAATGLAPSINVEGETNTGIQVAVLGTGVGRLRHDATDALTWDSTRVDARYPLRLPSYTVATLPSVGTHERSLIYVSDGTGDKRLAISTGVNWRWPDGTIVS